MRRYVFRVCGLFERIVFGYSLTFLKRITSRFRVLIRCSPVLSVPLCNVAVPTRVFYYRLGFHDLLAIFIFIVFEYNDQLYIIPG